MNSERKRELTDALMENEGISLAEARELVKDTNRRRVRRVGKINPEKYAAARRLLSKNRKK